MKLSKRDVPDILKRANENIVPIDLTGNSATNPKEVAKIVIVLINTLLSNVKPHLRLPFRNKIQHKFRQLNLLDISSKKIPPGARIGNSITILKNLLNGQHPVFISEVMRLVLKYL